jgi:copper chaperone CopZ
MKLLLPLILVSAAAGAAVVAYRAPKADYVPPTAEEGAASIPSRLSAPPAAGETVRVIEVRGMCCQSCAGKLYHRLTAVDGVREACVDFDSGTASVRVLEGVPDAELERALSFDKYSAVARR